MNLPNHSLRLSTDYKLVAFDELEANYRASFKDLTNDPDFYGLLLPIPESSKSIRAVCKNTAALIRNIESDGGLDEHKDADIRHEINLLLRKLLYDGVLTGNARDGECATFSAPEFSPTSISELAISHAMDLNFLDPRQLAARLYVFNRLPWSAKLSIHSLYDESKFVAVYGNPSSCWQSQNSHSSQGTWMYLRRKNGDGRNRGSEAFKLYLNVHPYDVNSLLRQFLPLIDSVIAHSIKIACNSLAMMRPDKFILYFNSRETMEDAANIICPILGSYRVQALPFTSPLTANGILTWGQDPESSNDRIQWMEQDSHRSAVCNLIAASLFACRHLSSKFDKWNFLVKRLAMEGISPLQWLYSEANR